MPNLPRLIASAAKLEQDGAETATVLAAGLRLPTPDRPDLAAAAARFAALRAETQAVARRIRPLLAGQDGAASEALDALNERLAHWRAVEEAVEVCLSGRDWPLLPDPAPRFDLAGAQAAVVSAVFTRAHQAVTPMEQDDGAAAYGCYSDIALSAAQFAADAHLALRLWLARKHGGRLRFLDVGCGGGMKVALAASYFDECDGIEFDPGYAGAARRALLAMRLSRCAVAEADALAYDGYGGFEVIYFFQPMRDAERLHALEARIAAQAVPGTVLIAPYSGFRDRARGLGCAAVTGSVYLAGTDEAQADLWAAEARRMGPEVAGEVAPPPPRLGWLRPLWLASAANGIRPR